MVVPPATGGSVAVCAPSPPPRSLHAKDRRSSGPTASTRAANSKRPEYPNYAPHIPFSVRRAPPLDLSTVERKGHPHARPEGPRRSRPHGLQEAPTFRPTEDEFRDPMAYMRKIAPEGRKYGICKIIPPDSWNPPFAIDTEKFHFRTRRQELNSVEGSTRTNLNYLDQLAKFHKQHGMNLNRFPSVDKRPLDLYKLKKAVEIRGGFDQVCRLKKWAEIGRDLGYSGKIMSSLSTSLKNAYQKWLYAYEEYLRVAKPGVQQQLELQNGGPFINSPSNSNAALPAGDRASLKSDDDLTVSALSSPGSRSETLPMTNGVSLRTDSYSQLPPAAPATNGGFTSVNAEVARPKDPFIKEEAADATAASRTMKFDDNETESAHSHVSGSRLKRNLSYDEMANGDTPPGSLSQSDERGPANGRRAKRQKKETVPTVAGSHMSLLRPLQPRMSGASRSTTGPGSPEDAKPGERCEGCGLPDSPSLLVICDSCDNGYHRRCISMPAKAPGGAWHCPRCLVGTGEFGFEEGGIYGLRQFQEKANRFKESYFASRSEEDESTVPQKRQPVSEEEVEREFWRLVESITETVEVEYGADIHSTTHGSGFPEVEKDPLNPYAIDPWNLNILPLHSESLFRHIKTDISGMTVPWLYVGMCFSTFCWHNEDHYTYSANYQHFGATKTWYGIPGEDADRFEQAMRAAVPELFEQQPDLLFQLVTLLPPDQLRKAGVNVYALDQRAGQFVITFPQAYHAGFNHGFNFNEAVNFAPSDWEPFGQWSVERLQAFRRPPCFSHEELLVTAAAQDSSIATARWLAPALERVRDRYTKQRKYFADRHQEFCGNERCYTAGSTDTQDGQTCSLRWLGESDDGVEEDYTCVYCKAYTYLARFHCKVSNTNLCLEHAGSYPCCDASEAERYRGPDHHLRYRLGQDGLDAIVDKARVRANQPDVWQEKLDRALEEESRPALRTLRSLVSEGERIPFALPGLNDLKAYVERCNEWVEEATSYITRKQQNRRKNDRSWRGSTSGKTATEREERDRGLRRISNMEKLLRDADELSFDCPEINTLRERFDDISSFQKEARAILKDPTIKTSHEIEDLIELGKGFSVDVPEVESLEGVARQLRWYDEARELQSRSSMPSLSDVDALLQQANELHIPEKHALRKKWQEAKEQGESWEEKAQVQIKAETTNYHQLEALATQANEIPVSAETRLAIDEILSKQREAVQQVQGLYEQSNDPDYAQRPRYHDAREIFDSLGDLPVRPTGASDLEKQLKRHEDWMRRGKRLFGKANAPLHILESHMRLVRDRNECCLDLRDKPRMPVEPASRAASPKEEEEVEPSGRDIFCLCRQPEAGLMIECELCHEWYHAKCMKIARGRIKPEDKYTCPICDWRVKIPRDAARPKLEDLQDWQHEINSLPFQPDEEDVLEDLISTGQEFRDFIRPFTNPMLSTPDEITTQRFYLRKIEGADILLAPETNFFRQELHRWAPIAPQPPPMIEVSLSTRKPRPTKQQKIMAQLGITNPDDLPVQYRTKQHSFKSERRAQESSIKKPLQPAPSPSLSKAPDAGANGTPNSATMASGMGLDSLSSSYRPPTSLPPTSAADPQYANMFALPASPPTTGSEFVGRSPSAFAWGPRSGPNPASPEYPPGTPLRGMSGPTLDATGYSPSGDDSFAAAALHEATAAAAAGSSAAGAASALVSPVPLAFDPARRSTSFDPARRLHSEVGLANGSRGENGESSLSNLFVDPALQNEAGAALEGLGIVHERPVEPEVEKEQTQQLAAEFLES